MNQDKAIEEFAKTREDKDELKILRQRPSMLGDEKWKHYTKLH